MLLSDHVVDVVMSFAKTVDGAERGVDVLSLFVDAWPALKSAADTIDSLRTKVQSGHMGMPAPRTPKQLWVVARGAIARAEKAFAVALRAIYCSRRRSALSGCLVRGLRALLSVSAGASTGLDATTDSAGWALPPLKMCREVSALQHAVRRAEAIVEQTTAGRGVTQRHNRGDSQASMRTYRVDCRVAWIRVE
jgi:hypothetical protein